MSLRELTYDGRQLCSSRDPLKEAKGWCDLMLAAEKNGPASHYWVIGLGAGFHIEELARRRNESVISVIEFRESLVDSFLEDSSWGKALRGQVLVERVSGTQELFQSRSFLVYGLQFSRVFRFIPCLQGLEDWSSAVESDLLGRSPSGFKTISKLLDLSIPGFESRIRENESINIKMIDSLFDGAPMSEQKKMVSLLKELVR
jgi:hypothetical protein